MTVNTRNPRMWAVVAEPASVVYAERPTRAEVEAVVAEQEHLIRHFGSPRIDAPTVVDLPTEYHGGTE